MKVNFYNVADDPDTIGKTLGTAVHSATVNPFEAIDDLNYRVIMDYSAALDAANYAEADSRYYFITDRTKITGGRIELICAIDVLETYASGIANLHVIVQRTAADPETSADGIGWNSLLDDQKIVTQVNSRVFEVGLDGISEFTYDFRPYLACIGCDTPDGTMKSNRVKGYDVYT